MVILYVILGYDPVVFHFLFRQEIHRICFLLEGVPHIFLIGKHPVNGSGAPCHFPCYRRNALSFQNPFDAVTAVAFQIQLVNPPHQLRFFRYDHKISVFIFRIAQKSAVVHHDLSFLKLPYNTPMTVFADIPAFFLCLTAQYGQKQFSAALHGIDAFFLEYDRDILFFQLSDVSQGIHRISGKAADGLCQYHIDFSCHTVLDHCLKIQTFFGTGGTFPIIGINASQFPTGVILYLFPIVVYLCFITAFLLFL